jgi:hypothetical protein
LGLIFSVTSGLILLHEITHALLGQREGDQHGEEFRFKLRAIGGGLFDATGVRS